jgi:hypothetical protein
MRRLAALVLVLVPVAAGQAGVAMEATVSFDGEGNPFSRLRLDGSITFSGDRAAEFRGALDQDNDGRVSAQEAADAQAVFEAALGEDPSEALGSNLTLDGREGRDGRIEEVAMEGLEGSASSSAPFTVRVVATVAFTPQSGSRHTLRMGGGDAQEPQAESFRIVFQAPPGYAIQSTTGMPAGSELSPDKTRFTVTRIPEGEESTVVFASGKGSPGLAAWATLAAVAAAAGLAVSRRPAKGQK